MKDLNKLDHHLAMWEMTSHDAHFHRVAVARRQKGALIARGIRREETLKKWSAP